MTWSPLSLRNRPFHASSNHLEYSYDSACCRIVALVMLYINFATEYVCLSVCPHDYSIMRWARKLNSVLWGFVEKCKAKFEDEHNPPTPSGSHHTKVYPISNDFRFMHGNSIVCWAMKLKFCIYSFNELIKAKFEDEQHHYIPWGTSHTKVYTKFRIYEFFQFFVMTFTD